MALATLMFIVSLFSALSLHFAEASVGVCYGRVGNNLPSETEVVNLYKANGIGSMRLYEPNLPTLQALQGSGIKLLLGVPNESLQSFATNQAAANQWVQTYVVPFASTIKHIVAGNEIHPSDQQASSVLPAMKNILNALKSTNLSDRIGVTIAIDTGLLKNSYPPSAGEFSDTSYINPIVQFLAQNGSPLLVNTYTYFAYISNKQSISLDYALFRTNGTVVTDPNNGKAYQYLFDAIVDSVYAALSKAGATNTEVVVSETGWPSDEGDSATVDNAKAYYTNVINHVKNNGTPLKPGKVIETYLFALFDENLKPGAKSEQHFGLFNPTNKQPKYGKLNFSS